MRASLLTRLLVAFALVAVCSIAATAWIAIQGTSGAIRQQQGQVLAADQKIYDTLLGFATRQPIWNGVEETLAQLERETGRRITITSESRNKIAGADVNPLPVNASALIDPLNVDPTLKPGGPIDPRATGPFQLTAQERDELLGAAEDLRTCLAGGGVDTVLVETPSGRPVLERPGLASNSVQTRCSFDLVRLSDDFLGKLTDTEDKARDELHALFEKCMGRTEAPLLMTGAGEMVVNPKALDEPRTRCLESARREQLDPYVAPRALLFITSPEGTPETPGLTSAGTARIVGAALAVLVITIVVSFLVARRLVRPLKQLTVAAQQMRAGDTQARVEPAKGEIGEVSEAFNEMAEHLARTEQQRQHMISDVSHELRTPVGNIRGWLVATQDGVADLDDELVASLLEETLLLQHLVDDLQQLALADAGQLKIHPERMDLADVLDQFTAHGRVQVGVHGDLTVNADPLRLRQVVGNLVANALKHSEHQVGLTGTRHHNHVEITVTDRGTGIAAEDLPHVFERFWRADKSRSRQTGGSGLGLAIVRNLVELHGGQVAVTSRPGETTFTVKLPA